MIAFVADRQILALTQSEALLLLPASSPHLLPNHLIALSTLPFPATTQHRSVTFLVPITDIHGVHSIKEAACNDSQGHILVKDLELEIPATIICRVPPKYACSNGSRYSPEPYFGVG